MKRIFSVVLVVIMLLSVMALSAGAAGSVIFEDNFDMGFKPANWIQGESCAFKWDEPNQCIIGYGDARVLQSNYGARDPKMWDKFYASYDFQIRGFDDLEETQEIHTVGIWVRDLFESEAIGAVYNFFIEIDGKNEDGTPSEKSRVYVVKDHTFNYRDENGILQDGAINGVIAEAEVDTKIEVGENAPFYELGVRITEGKLECYFEQELVISLEANENDEKLGDYALKNVDATLGSQRTPVLFLASKYNADLYCAVDNFRVMTPNYDFIDSIPGDVDGNAKVNIADASLLLKKIAGWEVTIDESAADANGDAKINIADVSLLLKYIAGWEVTLGPQA